MSDPFATVPKDAASITYALDAGLFYAPPDYQRVHPLPEQTHFHMMFGFKCKENSFGPSGDGVLSVKSETRIEAAEAAESILPLDYNHVDIVHSPEAVERLNLILGNHFEKGWRLLGN
jgi:hypothetical protein